MTGEQLILIKALIQPMNSSIVLLASLSGIFFTKKITSKQQGWLYCTGYQHN